MSEPSSGTPSDSTPETNSTLEPPLRARVRSTLSDSSLETGSTLNTITQAARDGAADAREMANRVWAGTSLFLCRFVYTTSYTISYGVVFPATLIARSVPVDNAAVRGLIDGARAATDRVHAMKDIEHSTPSALTVS